MASSIEWTDETWNPVTGCSRVSPAATTATCSPCIHASTRWACQGMRPRRTSCRCYRNRLKAPLTWAKPRRVFVNSMSDLFHIRRWTSRVHHGSVQGNARGEINTSSRCLPSGPALPSGGGNSAASTEFGEWPKNVWIGTSVENQKYAPRLTVLGRIPAEVRFVSAEPLLELTRPHGVAMRTTHSQWVIVGGESGPRARPMEAALGTSPSSRPFASPRK